MEELIVAIIFAILVYVGIGWIISLMVSDFSTEDYGGAEFLGILIFWPILGIIFGILGAIEVVIKFYISVKESNEE